MWITFILNKITEFCQMAYKPGSVSTNSGDDHSSWTYVAINLQQPTRITLKETFITLFLFGLAPSGVCLAKYVTIFAVRSYRTFSPLPKWRYIFCGTFPEVTLAGHYPALRLSEPGLSSHKSAIIQPSDYFFLLKNNNLVKK